MIEALISGKLMGTPTQRTGRNGNTLTVAKVRVPTGEDSAFCNVITFSESGDRPPHHEAAQGDATEP